MNAFNRPVIDRFWPIFLACFGIGVAELGAVLCVCLGQHDLAEDLDAYWWAGLCLSVWLWPQNSPDGTGSGAKGILNRSWDEAARVARVAVGAILAGIGIVFTAGWFLSPPWPIVVRGTAVGLYLLVICRFAWARDPVSESSARWLVSAEKWADGSQRLP